MYVARALGTLLLLLVVVGCAKTPSPPPELQREYIEQFQTVPELPTSTELKREFLHNDGEFILQVTFSVSEYHFRDRDYRETFGGGVWVYTGSKTEVDGHFYAKDGWRLTIRRGPRDDKVRVLISKEE